MAFERLLIDGAAASAFLSCLHAEEMVVVRGASPLARDCVDMYTEGKMLPLLRATEFWDNPRHRGCRGAVCRGCMVRRRHMKRVFVERAEQMKELDSCTAMEELSFSLMCSFMFPAVDATDSSWSLVFERPAWTARVRTLILFGVVGNKFTTSHVAVLSNLHTLKYMHVFSYLRPLDLGACTALRVLRLPCKALVRTVVPPWVEHVIVDDVDADTETRMVQVLHNVPSITIVGSFDVDVSPLVHTRSLELEWKSREAPSFRLPPTLTHFSLRVKALHLLSIELPAMGHILHVTLDSVLLPRTWIAALRHVQTLSLVGSYCWHELPSAAEWAEFTSLQALDLHVSMLYLHNRLRSLDSFTGLPRTVRLRLSARSDVVSPSASHPKVNWATVRDGATTVLFALGISAAPI